MPGRMGFQINSARILIVEFDCICPEGHRIPRSNAHSWMRFSIFYMLNYEWIYLQLRMNYHNNE